MAPFIRFTANADDGSKREKFVNVLYVVAADFDEESGELELTVTQGGQFNQHILQGKEATAALAVLRRRMA